MTATPMDRAVRDLALRQHGAFSVRQAHKLGASRKVIERRVAREEWEVVGDGVLRLTGSAPTWRQRLQIALLIAGPDAVVSHRSAAALERVPGFLPGPIEILTPHGRTNHRLIDGTVHESRRIPKHHVTIIDGLPVTTVARTLCDLASIAWGIHPKRLERAIDNALAMRLTTCEELWRVWGDLVSKGRRGVQLLRALLFERLPGYVAPASELEAIFRDLVRRAGFDDPERQVDLGDGAWVGRVDFYFRRARLIVEVDGKLGHSSKLDIDNDARRDDSFHRAGWRVRRFTWEDLISRPQWVIAELRKEMALAA